MLDVSIDDELERRLTAFAGSQGRTVADVAQEAIRRHVDRYDADFLAEARRQSLAAAARGWTDEDREWEALAAAEDDLSDLDPAHKAAE